MKNAPKWFVTYIAFSRKYVNICNAAGWTKLIGQSNITASSDCTLCWLLFYCFIITINSSLWYLSLFLLGTSDYFSVPPYYLKLFISFNIFLLVLFHSKLSCSSLHFFLSVVTVSIIIKKKVVIVLVQMKLWYWHIPIFSVLSGYNKILFFSFHCLLYWII